MKNNFVFVKDTHSYSTRVNTYRFRVPKCHGKENVTFYYSIIKDWKE